MECLVASCLDLAQDAAVRSGCAVVYIEGVPHLRLSEECGLAGLLLSRVAHADSPPHTQRRITLDSPSHTAFFGAHTVRLTRTEFQILRRLLISGAALVPVERLLLDVWGYMPAIGGPNLVRTHVRNIREKFRKTGVAHTVIEAVRGRGYRLGQLSGAEQR